MLRPLAEECPTLRSSLSHQIVSLELELCVLAPQISTLEGLLERKAEIEKRVSFLREMEEAL